MATITVHITFEGKTRAEIEAWALDRLLSELNTLGLGEDSFVHIEENAEEAEDGQTP